MGPDDEHECAAARFRAGHVGALGVNDTVVG
jgi:hypothetical protein